MLQAKGIVPHDPQPQLSTDSKAGGTLPAPTNSYQALPGFFNVERENANVDADDAALCAETPAAYVKSSKRPSPSNVIRKHIDSKDAALTAEIPAARISPPANTGPSKSKRKDMANVEEAALAAEIKATQVRSTISCFLPDTYR